MRLHTRKLLDRAFSSIGIISILLMAATLVVLLLPIIARGLSAYVFRATCEHRRAMHELFGKGDKAAIEAETRQVAAARQPLFEMLTAFEKDQQAELASVVESLRALAGTERGKPVARTLNRRLGKLAAGAALEDVLETITRSRDTLLEQPDPKPFAPEIEIVNRALEGLEKENKALMELKQSLRALLGPLPGDQRSELLRNQYGQNRWDRAQVKLHEVLIRESWDYSDPSRPGVRVRTPRIEEFRGTDLEPLFGHLEKNLDAMLLPRLTFYPGFLTTSSRDAHFFGGIWPEVLGTFYLTIGAMLFAIPMGVIAAIYLCEYARPSRTVSLLRSCISTLAGVPSIVFGLFGLAFFLNTLHISSSKSVLAGALTLALMILPTVIRASEEAILAVPATYKEAALGLGAGRWHTVLTVVLPAALPGILTGIVISMGRAAGETAPIIFTAAVSVGLPLSLGQTLDNPTPALPWNIYNLCTEHEAVDEIRHVQFGMVFTLVALVLLLNVAAIVARARLARKLRG